MTRPGIVAPIASATKIAQLDDLIAAVTLQLDGVALADLEKTSA
jgi:aryl-alcohol dehydrogenase-like predicted oxidoreductase